MFIVDNHLKMLKMYLFYPIKMCQNQITKFVDRTNRKAKTRNKPT